MNSFSEIFDQLNIVSVSITPCPFNKYINVFVGLDRINFNLETNLNFDATKFKNASEAVEHILLNLNLAEVFSNQNPVWNAVAFLKPNKHYNLSFKQAKHQYKAAMQDPELIPRITAKVVEFQKYINTMIEFGFDHDLLHNAFFNPRLKSSFNHLDIIGYCQLYSLKNNPRVEVESIKLIEPHKIKVKFSTKGDPISLTDDIALHSECILNVDYKDHTLKLLRIKSNELSYSSVDPNDDDLVDHYDMDELNNIHEFNNDTEILDLDKANTFIDGVIQSEIVLAKLTDIIFDEKIAK